jgi:hypothetical protein
MKYLHQTAPVLDFVSCCFFTLLQGGAGFTAEQVALLDFFVAAAANQGNFNDFLGGIAPALMLYPNQFTAIAPRVRKGVPVVVKIAEKAKISSVNQMLADERLIADTMRVTANRCHSSPQKRSSRRTLPMAPGCR